VSLETKLTNYTAVKSKIKFKIKNEWIKCWLSFLG